MRCSFKDVPIAAETPEGKFRMTESGGMIIEFGEIASDFDPRPLFRGLPDNKCQCPHWGYVISGRIRVQYADHEEVCKAGDIYHIKPGHLSIFEGGTKYVEFSPSDKFQKTMEVVQKNLAAMDAE